MALGQENDAAKPPQVELPVVNGLGRGVTCSLAHLDLAVREPNQIVAERVRETGEDRDGYAQPPELELPATAHLRHACLSEPLAALTQSRYLPWPFPTVTWPDSASGEAN